MATLEVKVEETVRLADDVRPAMAPRSSLEAAGLSPAGVLYARAMLAAFVSRSNLARRREAETSPAVGRRRRGRR